MAPGFWKDVKDIHFNTEEFFDRVKNQGFLEPAKFAASVGLIFGLLISLFLSISLIIGESTAVSFLFAAALILIILPVSLVVSGFFQSLMVHIAVMMFGERGFEKTFNAVTYPVSAVLLWGWIPVLNLVASIYSIYLQAKGVEKLHNLSFGKALIAVIWPIILSLILTIGLIFIFFLAGLGLAAA